MTDIQAVAFDKDGTLFDSERLYAESLVITCDKLGYNVTEKQREQFFGLAADNTFALLAKAIGPAFDRDKMIAMWLGERDRLIEEQGMGMIAGAEKALLYCHEQGYPMALVTSDDHDGVLHDFGHADEHLFGLFSVVITVDNVSKPKPDPEPYLRAAAYLGVAPQNMLVVEDSIHGAEAALAAGCPLAIHPSTPLPDHISQKAVKILKRIDEIKELL